MQRFTDLKVWQRSHALVLLVYPMTGKFPGDERFGLVSQLRRAAVSVAANIAEGTKRRTPQDYAHFLNVAEGSLAETAYLMMLARDLGYVATDHVEPMISEADEIGRMLFALRTQVEQAIR